MTKFSHRGVRRCRRGTDDRAVSGVAPWAVLALVALCLTGAPTACRAGLAIGEKAPIFSLAGTDGSKHALAPESGPGLLILYFFDADSEASCSGLEFLNGLAARERADVFRVLAVTLSPKDRVTGLQVTKTANFPILLDTSGVSELYQAKIVLPVTYLLASDLEIIGVLVGGGTGNQVRLKRLLAERTRSQGPPPPQESLESLRQQGLDAFSRKDYAEAEADFLQVLARQPDAASYLYLAYSQMELGKKAELGNTLRQAISEFPNEVRLHRMYAKYLIDQGDREGALKVLNEALALQPDDINLKMLKDYLMNPGSSQAPQDGDGH